MAEVIFETVHARGHLSIFLPAKHENVGMSYGVLLWRSLHQKAVEASFVSG